MRGQLADYVLGQQSGAEATATKGHLRRSEAARTWTRSLLDSLEQLYVNGSMPAVPEGERGRRAGAARSAPGEPGLARPLAPDGARRRLIAAAAAALAALLLIVLIWPVGVLTGGDDESGSWPATSPARRPRTQTTVRSGGRGAPAGIAIIVEQKGKRQLLVQAAT